MLSDHAFFSFVEISDPAQHREYNEWHLYDHRPENLALPGVAWGDRWARRKGAESAAPHRGETPYTETDYVAMYWFHKPHQDAVAEWFKLGSDSFQWGRGPDVPGVVRRLTAFFTPVKGYAHQRVLVRPDVLPYRPNQGLHVTLSHLPEPHSRETHALHRWYDRVRIPKLLEIPGVAGAWTFSLSEVLPQSRTETPDYPPGSLRIRLLYLDGEPEAVTREINDAERSDTDPAGTERVLLSAPVHTIVPFRDW